MDEIEIPKSDEMQEVKHDRFAKRVALITAFYAVLMALVSVGGSKATKEMIMSQQKASDQWAFYQSKAMREYMSELADQQVTLSYNEKKGNMPQSIHKQYLETLSTIRGQTAKYAGEKKQIQHDAEDFEKEREKWRVKDPYFEFAQVFMQISIVMASISILAAAPFILYMSICSASIGTMLMLNGYFLIINLPLVG